MCISLSTASDFCGDTTLYWALVLLIYPLILYTSQRLGTARTQMHREALALRPDHRNLTQIVLYRIFQSSIGVASILLITSGNLGIIISSILGHAVGIYFVFKYQRTDHTHPIKQLARAMRQSKKYEGYEQDLSYIKLVLQSKETTEFSDLKRLF